MKHNYLGGKSWTEITREERYFCFELFDAIRKNPQPFLELIGKNKLENVEVAVEVCFYRDLLFDNGIAIKDHNNSQNDDEKLSQKRTFDLVIFAKDEIILFEAKVSEGFGGEQFTAIKEKKYRKSIHKIFKLIGITEIPTTISMMAIHSSKNRLKVETKRFFDDTITWKELSEKYKSKESIFSRADLLYKLKANNKKSK